MAWLFNLAYLAIIVLVSPWLIYSAVRHGKYREGWSKKLLGRVPRRTSNRRCVWLHAVSLGEVNLLQTILQRIEREFPDWDVVISATTAAGYAQARRKYAPRTVFYAPLDFSRAVGNALARVRPDLLLLAELEVWPNLLRAAKRRGVKVAVINGRLGEKSFRGYRRLRWLLQSTFARIDLVAAQSEEYAGRFRALGCRDECLHVTGSLKFDGAQSDRQNPATKRLARLTGLREDDIVFLAGSTQAPEESLALDAFEKHAAAYPNLKLILVPRHSERFDEVAELLDRRGVSWQRRSGLWEDESPAEPHSMAPQERCPPRVLLVDAVGELAAWWGAATIAYVGGSMGNRGGQNMIEPAAYGAAVSFGENTWNFRDIVSLLLASDAAVVVRDGEELAGFVGHCLSDPDYAAALGRRAAELVRKQLGATEQTMLLLNSLMIPKPLDAHRRIDAPQLVGDVARSTSMRRAM